MAPGKARKEATMMARLGIDEKAFLKGQNDLTLLYDLDNSTMEAISDGNDTDSGIDCLFQLSGGQVQAIEAIAIDMCARTSRPRRKSFRCRKTRLFTIDSI